MPRAPLLGEVHLVHAARTHDKHAHPPQHSAAASVATKLRDGAACARSCVARTSRIAGQVLQTTGHSQGKLTRGPVHEVGS